MIRSITLSNPLTAATVLFVGTATLLAIFAAPLLEEGLRAQEPCCVLPDNGNGTVDMPADCSDGYFGDLNIVDGLPADTTIEIIATLREIVGNEVPGGGLGGTTALFDAVLELQMSGTGDLAGFNRLIAVQVNGQMDSGPRTSGDEVQDFNAELVALSGNIIGDPDFETLAVTMGTDFGLPSPGHTTLTRLGLPGSDFQVDSFFDIAYRIEFQGAPGSVLEGFGGVTVDESRILTCAEPVGVERRSWSDVKSRYGE